MYKNGSELSSVSAFTASHITDIDNQFGFNNDNNPNSGFTSNEYNETLTVPAPSGGSTSTTTTYSVKGDSNAGVAKLDNKGNTDTRTAGTTTNTPQTARSNFGNSTKTITGIYPYFYGSSSTLPTTSDIQQAISGGTANKVISSASSNIVINYNVTDKYIWFAHLSNYAYKTTWTVVSGSNEGEIGTQFIDNPIPNVSVNSQSGLWSGINYDIYISYYATTLTTPITFS
jgi:hypothetical protein